MLSSFTRSEKFAILIIAGGIFLLHLITNLMGAYGFFRDELYYIACSDHLAWGYVDQPPFSLFLLKISRIIFGDSLTAIRLVPSLMHAATIVITGMMVKEMGGKTMAIFLACLAVTCSLIHIGMSVIYSMNAIDIFLWSLATYLIIKLINTQNQKIWIWIGLVLGIGLLNKISVLFLGAGIFVGIVFTNRSWFAHKYIYIAGGLVLLLFLPYILWNVANDYAHLEFIRNASGGKYSGLSAFTFIKEQLTLLNPISTPFWICGLVAIFFYKPLQQYKIIGWIYLTAFAILIINGSSKGEYLAPAYASLFAVAGTFLEQKLKSKSVAWIKYAYPVILLMATTALLPLVLPILPVKGFISYSKKMGIEPSSNEGKVLAQLPQFYADMFGWEEKANDVAAVFNTLTNEEKEKCAIFSTNYGRCGAIDFYGEQLGLPKSIGNHNNYFLWGPREYTGELMMILGGDLEDHIEDFESVVLVKTSTCTYCMPYENNVKIFLARNLKYSLPEVWQYEKHYD